MGTTLSGNPTTVYRKSKGEKFAGDCNLVVVNCATCGVTYAIPESFHRSALRYRGDRSDGWKICCPFGHTWWYTGETEIEKAKRQAREARERLAAERAWHDQTKASLRSTKGVVTKQRKKLGRVRNGVCPCCNRTFENLGRHMETKHPEYDPAK